MKHKCRICGFIYDPEKGIPEDDIDPGIPFENLPEDWTCPICGAKKDKFIKQSV